MLWVIMIRMYLNSLPLEKEAHGRGGGGVKKERRAGIKEGRKGDKGRWMEESLRNLHESDEILLLSLNWEEITRGL